MEKLKDKEYWQLILMRALKTFVQTLISTGGLATITTITELMAIDWKYVLIASVGAGVLSIINNIVGTIPEYTAIEEALPELYNPEVEDPKEVENNVVSDDTCETD